MQTIDWTAVKAATLGYAAQYFGEIPRDRKVKCPRHADKTPSLHVYDDGFHCYSCGWHGDAVDLVMEIERVDKRQAVKMVTGEGWIPAPLSAHVMKPEPAPVAWVEAGMDDPTPSIPDHWSLGPPDRVWWYRRDGLTIGAACRWDTPEGKTIRPISWRRHVGTGEMAWRWQAMDTPRPLYRPDSVRDLLVIVEGEKAAERLRSIKVEAATWPGGGHAVDDADWSMVTQGTVILWPDNDEPGHKAMARVRSILEGAGKVVRVVDVSRLPEKADAADVDDATCLALLKGARVPSVVVQAEVVTEAAPLPARKGIEPFRCLGCRGDKFFYLDNVRQTVVTMTAAGSTARALLGLASVDYWLAMFPKKGGWDSEAAASRIMDECKALGFYSEEQQRGRGVWLDRGRVVYHAGDVLHVDGDLVRVADLQTAYTYQVAPAMLHPAAPLTDAEAQELILDTARLPSWQDPAHADIIAGWIVCSMLAGVLAWRPSIWIQAPAGTGKTTIMRDFIGRLLGPMAEQPLGSSTEAGIRQSIKDDARAVIMDEAEPGDEADMRRFKAIMQLMRQASSDGDGRVLRGTASGEAQSYHVRAPFAFGSIQSSLNLAADRDRVTKASLKSVRAGDMTQAEADQVHKDWKEALKVWPEDIAERLLGRVLALAPIARDTMRAMGAAMRPHVGSQREADQIGALMGGSWLLTSSSVPTDDEAAAWVGQHRWDVVNEATTETDAERALHALLGIVIQGDSGERASIADRIQAVRHGADKRHAQALAWFGLRVHDDGRRLFIASTNENRARELKATPWASDLVGLMRQLPGTVKDTQRIDGSGPRKGVTINLPLDP